MEQSKKDEKAPAKKLSLKKDTLRVLTDSELEKVGGGAVSQTLAPTYGESDACLR
jgi:hypothetical protein